MPQHAPTKQAPDTVPTTLALGSHDVWQLKSAARRSLPSHLVENDFCKKLCKYLKQDAQTSHTFNVMARSPNPNDGQFTKPVHVHKVT